jgi:hypothetical protein
MDASLVSKSLAYLALPKKSGFLGFSFSSPAIKNLSKVPCHVGIGGNGFQSFGEMGLLLNQISDKLDFMTVVGLTSLTTHTDLHGLIRNISKKNIPVFAFGGGYSTLNNSSLRTTHALDSPYQSQIELIKSGALLLQQDAGTFLSFTERMNKIFSTSDSLGHAVQKILREANDQKFNKDFSALRNKLYL